MVQANNEGKYGPFVVYYKDISSNITIKVNGRELSFVPNSGEEFYLSEEELRGINGEIPEQSTMEVIDEGEIYNGYYYKYAPIDTQRFYAPINNYLPIDMYIIGNPLLGIQSHSILQAANYYQIDFEQRVILIEPEIMPFTEIKSISFKTGINLSGKVWLDGQTGLKPVISANGLQDRNETMFSGIEVRAIKGSTGEILKTTYTDANGRYELKNVPTDKNGVYIEFVYDGVNYKVTTPNAGREDIDSDAIDVNRTGFNNRFKTITKSVAIGTNGSLTGLKYNYSDKNAILETYYNGRLKPEFAIIARTTEGYTKNTENIDCGLVKKGVDLAAVTDILSATVSINGVSKEYTYNTILSLGKNITIEPVAPKYNLSLYNSDYNYRIKDILLGGTHSIEQDKQTLLDKRIADGELQIKLTYRILFNNQSATTATINQIAYYYDARLYNEKESNNPETVKIDGKDYKKMIIDVNGNNTLTEKNNQTSLDIPFTVGRDVVGTIELGDIKNWVEIVSYSTDDGCIDCDSAPDNIMEHRMEDDTDDAGALTIKLREDLRQISGYVFEDKKTSNQGAYNIGNGILDNNEIKINGVIVQLIEIKEKDGKMLEYIWQETVTGSNKVKRVKADGSEIETYDVNNSQGQYLFQDFIPSTYYIVRFIYGDGTYYDKAIDGTTTSSTAQEDIRKYNGQDYKSTKDDTYKSTFYDGKSDFSRARDNEARRIEEMAYATGSGITKEDLTIDSKDKLNKTWMCADSSYILVQLPATDDAPADVKTVNFGLVKRPQIKLELEKHITHLKIDGVTEASANIEDYIDGNNLLVKLNGESGESIFATATSKSKNQRGKWTIQTELEKLAGKTMNITYSYIVRNIGDLDYIGNELINNSYVEAAQKAKEKYYSAEQKESIGTYLGQAYYTGIKGDNETLVTAKFKIEDYLGKTKNILHIASEDNFEITGRNVDKNIYDSKGNNLNKEKVDIINTKDISIDGKNYITKKVELSSTLDITSGKDITFRSYVAQLIPVDNKIVTATGTLMTKDMNTLREVQSYAPESTIALNKLTEKKTQFIAETVLITKDTGMDKLTPIILIASITGGLAVIAIGIVLIKKFVIK